MPNLVEQIQREAVDKNTSVSELLRKVKLAAAKLKLERVEDWVDSELKGYSGEVPEYRKVAGSPVVQHIYHGAIPLQLSAQTEFFRTVRLGEPIAALEHSIASASEGFMRPFPQDFIAALNKDEGDVLSGGGVRFPKAALVTIVDAVRTLVLEWAIELERVGITGSDMSFNDEDKAKAKSASTIFNIHHIGTMTGNLGVGNLSGAITAAPIAIERVKSLVSQLGDYNSSLVKDGVDDSALAKLRTSLETELAKAVPNQSVLAQLLHEVSDKLKVAATSVAAQGIISLINQIVGFPG